MTSNQNENLTEQMLYESYRCDEAALIDANLSALKMSTEDKSAIHKIALRLVEKVREERIGKSMLDAFLFEYDLSSDEGIALMCLAEALLRIPDKATRTKLIEDKIGSGDWVSHSKNSDSTFVNAATWGLMLTGKMVVDEENDAGFGRVLKGFFNRSTKTVVRSSIAQAMKILGRQFVMGETIAKALKRAKTLESKGFSYSYDMLGEAARTEQEAVAYFQSYLQTIKAVGEAAEGKTLLKAPGVSIKLSALHPRYEFAQTKYVIPVVSERLLKLVELAKQYDISVTVDAEEADRLMLSLTIIENVFAAPSLAGWEGFGLAVQAYQKRGITMVKWCRDLAKKHKKKLMVRLVKGAYWDSEVKLTQELGLESYPVYTRKAATDVAYLLCAQKLLEASDSIYPQFATHNAHTVASILTFAKNKPFEFQCLHGMGQALYQTVVAEQGVACRIYAPVGGHETLLAYLVRRLLENGANSSFVNRIIDERAPVEDIIADPSVFLAQLPIKPHPRIPLPERMFGASRKNAKGWDLSNPYVLKSLNEGMQQARKNNWQAAPTLGKLSQCSKASVINPCSGETIAEVTLANQKVMEEAIVAAQKAQLSWNAQGVNQRASCLRKAANLLEEHSEELMAMLVDEAGKTLFDAVSEVREAVDFCRYYAVMAEKDLLTQVLPGPTGERNTLSFHGRGVMACISPWNFPLAIFMGQVTACLVTGNAVIAKPANQTPLIAAKAMALLHEAGVPKEVCQLLPGEGKTIGAGLVADDRIAGVLLTGSTATAKRINQSLAAREGAIVPLIAETGGQNAMIVDSTALPEQLILDVMKSAFGSAGQRCSALRVLYVQDDIADRVMHLIKGAMAEYRVGAPGILSTDVGPVIDDDAAHHLNAHIIRMNQEAKLIAKMHMPADLKGTFVQPHAFEIESLSQLTEEVFGPVLHVLRFKQGKLDDVIEQIHGTGFGLTGGLHSRIHSVIDEVSRKLRVGNLYVNRNMTGAVVGVQPFGGEGLSGTGPKAGGPHYLHRLVTERTLSVNTAAAGGNASLMGLEA